MQKTGPTLDIAQNTGNLPSRFIDVTMSDAQGREFVVPTHYLELGQGPVVVLVHGLMTSQHSFARIRNLLARHYRVVIPDLVGSGWTGKPQDFVYSLDNVSRFLEAFLDHLELKQPYLVGNSLGGLLCLRMLLRNPARVRRFANLHSPGYPLLRMYFLHALLSLPGMCRLTAGIARRWPQAFVRMNLHYNAPELRTPEDIEAYASVLATADGAWAFARILRESLNPREHRKIIQGLRQGGAEKLPPTLLLWAKRDRVVPPSFGPLFQQDLAGTELIWFHRASHFLQVEAPHATAGELMQFDPQVSAGRGFGLASTRKARS